MLIQNITPVELKWLCKDCPWANPDTCRICRQDRQIEIAEQIGTQTLRILHPRKSIWQRIRGK